MSEATQVPQADPDHDYTAEDRVYDGETPFDANPEDDLGGYMIDEVATPSYSADEIVEASGFEEMPVGEQRVKLIGFLTFKDRKSPVDPGWKDYYIIENGKKAKKSHKIVTLGVKLAMTDDPAKQTVFYCDLPPGDPEAYKCWSTGFEKEAMKPSTKGFKARIFWQFLEHGLGFPYPKNGTLPEEARDLRNWLRKEMFVTIVRGLEKEDPTTREMKAGKNQTKLFSFRPTPETLERLGRSGELASRERATVAQRAAKLVVARPKAAEPDGLADI